jgi:secreted trypsin-like serine protease
MFPIARAFLFAAVLQGAAAPDARAGLMMPGVSEQTYFDYGMALQGRLGYIGADGASSPAYCSVVFINERFAITAAHCINTANTQNPAPLYVGNAPDAHAPIQTARISRVIKHPLYVASEWRTTPDIAILEFSAPMAGISQVGFATT